MQTGARARLELGIRTIAQQKGLLQLIERSVHRPRAGKWAKIAAFFFARAAVLFDLWKRMVFADQNIGEALIITQQHIVLGLKLFDEVLFQKQRLGFRTCGQKHHRRGLGDHFLDPRAVTRTRIIGHPRAQIASLTDVKHPALFIEHPVHTRRCLQIFQVILNHGIAAQATVFGHFASGCVSRIAHLTYI